MKPQRLTDGERILAVFIDFENLALGFGSRRDRFSIDKVLERLVEKGKIVAKKAYADWSRFGYYTTSLHEAAVELIEIPKRVITGKNSADIRMCVDAMDLAYSKDHINTFVIVSGDSDFSPLVSKLKELGRDVIGLGLADSTSNLLRDNCDEFIYYEDLDRAPMIPLAEDESIPEPKRKLFALLLDSLLALRRENKDLIFSSMVKDTMKRKKPSFNEEYHGYRTFSELLEDASRFGILDLEKHKTGGGTYVVTRFGSEPRLNGGNGGGPMLPPLNRQALPMPERSRMPLPRPALPPAEPIRPPQAQPGFGPPPRRMDPAPEGPLPPRRMDPAPEGPLPPRRIVTLPPRPPAMPAPPIEARPMPDKSPPLKPFAQPVNDDDDRPRFGRELLEDLADFDDEIPSYMPRKPVAGTAPKPPELKPQAPARQAGRGPAPGRSPAAPRTPAVRREAEPAAKPEPRVAKPRAERAPARPPAEKPQRQPKAAAKPPAPAGDDDGFGAGLDD